MFEFLMVELYIFSGTDHEKKVLHDRVPSLGIKIRKLKMDLNMEALCIAAETNTDHNTLFRF